MVLDKVGYVLALTVMGVLWLVMLLSLSIFYIIASPILLLILGYRFIKSRRKPIF